MIFRQAFSTIKKPWAQFYAGQYIVFDCGATYEETWILKSVELDEDEAQVGG